VVKDHSAYRKTEAASFERLVYFYKTTRRQIPQGRNEGNVSTAKVWETLRSRIPNKHLLEIGVQIGGSFL